MQPAQRVRRGRQAGAGGIGATGATGPAGATALGQLVQPALQGRQAALVLPEPTGPVANGQWGDWRDGLSRRGRRSLALPEQLVP